MKFLFRVDAGAEIGLGHFYRSVALAKELKSRGHQINFIYSDSEFWRATIKKGFPFKTFILEGENNEARLAKNGFDVIYTDGNIVYEEEFANEIKMHAVLVMYQNLTDSRFCANYFILPSLHQNKSFFEGFSPTTIIFHGIEYFTFNEELNRLKSGKINETVKKIGVTTGGTDPSNALMKLVNQIGHSESFPDIDIHFFYGSNYLFKNQLPESNEKRFFLEFEYQKLLDCDLVISAFGVTTYELLALGMPVISFGHQESTAVASDYLSKVSSLFISLGLIDEIESSQLIEAVDKMMVYKNRMKFSLRSKTFIDLKGVNRVANILENINKDNIE